MTLSRKLELDLHEEDFTELLPAQHKGLSHEDLMEVEAQRKNRESQEEEEGAEEPERFTMQERGFSLFEEALLVFETQDPNVELFMKVARAIQNAIQCYQVIHDEKKRVDCLEITELFFKRVDRIESARNQNLCHQHQV